ncbi:MAG: aldehyde dehydrogenase [Flavobacteriaceae bacterium]|nr:aldehyde dehydrogenase [Flavobacteriaceae bacterium]
MKELIEHQRHFFRSHKTKDISFRLQQLKRLKRVLKSNEALLYEAIYADFKKSEFDTFATELGLVYHDIDDALRNLHKWSRKQHVKTNLVNFPAKSYVLPQPLGVALVIGAWNYPYLLSLGPVVAAMAAGCTIVLKPSEIPSNTSAAIKKVISEHFPTEYFTVVEGGIPETTALLKEKFDKIFFTGSTFVGKIIYKAAAEQLTPVTLELGGKSPAFVAEDCHLKMAVKRLVWGKFLNAGQTCVSPDYILVHRSIEQRFLALAKAEIEQENLRVENGNYVQIINDRNVERLEKMIDPEKIYYGGDVDRENRIISPTILSKVSWDDTVMQEEIFGPIMPVLVYDSLDEAVDRVNELSKPLSCYVFTKSAKTKKKVLNEILFGGGGVNENVVHLANPHLPFGGVGNSGMGSYHGEAGFRAFSHYKSIIEKTTLFELPLKYYPHTNGKLWWIKQFFKF